MRYFVLGDEDTVLGFGMVGVAGKVIGSVQEARDAFTEVLSDKRIGIIIVTERVAELIRVEVDTLLFKETFPLIVEIPDRKGPLEGRPGIREMVNTAIGIKL